MSKGVFPLFFAGNITYYKALTGFNGEIVLEMHEHFPKQTFRSRMEILGPNGRQKLIVPTRKTGSRRIASNVEISYEENWQKNHWKSLEAAYRRSPYFEFYEHQLAPIYQNKPERLWQLNEAIFIFVNRTLELNLDIRTSDEFKMDYSADFRENSFTLPEPNDLHSYIQVFSDRFSFEPNLSVFDAIFNLGPEAKRLFH